VCPRCQAPHSRYDANCKRCAKRAKKLEFILKLRDIRERSEAGQKVSPEEHKLLKDNNVLSWSEVTPKDLALLTEAPFALPEELSAVRPTYKNRLQFFLDRAQEQGRKMTTTHAASKLLKFDGKDDFVNFATDHGVKSVMTADWEQRFAAWRVEDILKLFHERQADTVTKKVTETEPGKLLTSPEASSMLGIPGTKTFVDLATEYGVKPAKTFGDKPEHMAWNVADVESLRRIHQLEAEAVHIEDAIQKLERDIAVLNSKPMKHPDMLVWREKTKDLGIIRNELTKIEQHLEREALKLQGLAEKQEQPVEPTKEASGHRLARILALAVGPEVTDRKTLIDRVYRISARAIGELLSDKDLSNLLDDGERTRATDGELTFDEIVTMMLDSLQVFTGEQVQPGQN
jgi:hypothetical protein